MTDKANISRRIDLLMARANHKETDPAEAEACREKAKELRARYNIPVIVPGPPPSQCHHRNGDTCNVNNPNWTPPNWVSRETNFDDLIPDEYQHDNEDGDW